MATIKLIHVAVLLNTSDFKLYNLLKGALDFSKIKRKFSEPCIRYFNVDQERINLINEF